MLDLFSSRRFVKGIWLIGFVAVASGLPGRASAETSSTNLPVLKTAQEVHRLTADQAKLEYPVHLRATVTFYDKEIDELFVQDETGGVFVLAHGDPGFSVQPGQLIEVEGTSAPGGFAPEIKPERLRLLGQGEMPTPKEVTIEQMATGHEDCRWVRCGGIVRSITTGRIDDLLALEIAGGGGRMLALIEKYDLEKCRRLIDAEVSVQGVCVAHFNNKRQLLQIGVQVSSMADISIKNPAPERPFDVPVRPINTLGQYAPEEEHGHRVKVGGVVTLQQPGRSLFIVDETQGLYIQTKQSDPVQLGDRVEALGFPGAGEYFTPVLQDAVFRKVGGGPAPAAVKITPEQGGKGNFDANLVQIEAQLLDRVRRRDDQILELQVSNLFFNAELDQPETKGDALSSIPNNSRVLLTGICLVHVNWGGRLPHSFSILLRSPNDVVLLARPSWWTAEHTLWLLGATMTVFVASLAWVVVLRNRVKVQTEIIGQKLQREAALEERTRIARDIHDDLGAGLTHIAFLSEVAQKERNHPHAVTEHLRVISNSAQEAVQALDEIVWVVDPKNDTIDNLTSYISHFAEAFFRVTSIRCRLDLPARLPERTITTDIRNNLFFAVKEALNNIGKHARASEVIVRIGMESSQFTIVIEDNGRGFDPGAVNGAGNGLANMRLRLEKISGRFDLESRPNGGTKIRFEIDL
jgi:signal transduction histidine kinase